MYGLVIKAIEDLVVSSAGEKAWQKIKARANQQDVEFLEATNYDDEVTYSLVTAASDELGLPASAILHDFGRHWILYTGREGWDSVFTLGGGNLKSFLMDLDNMHARVQVAMPESRMPQFTVVEKPDCLEVRYQSHRAGLAPLVGGMLSGLIERFDEDWEVLEMTGTQHAGYTMFQLKQIISSCGDELKENAA